MADRSTQSVIGSATSMIAGAVIAAVTLVGLISHTLNAGSDKPGDVNQATIPYGTTQ